MRESIQLQRILAVIKNYDGSQQLSFFLKNYYNKHREMGSRDRKLFTSAIYNWFRLGKACSELKDEVRLAIASFLIKNEADSLLEYLIQFTGLNAGDISKTPDEKLSLVKDNYPGFNLYDVFPFVDRLSKEVEADQFSRSMLIQPLTWIRIAGNTSVNQLPDNIYIEKDRNTIGVEPGIDLKKYELDFEVQDRSSQLTGEFFKPGPDEQWYDCCAGSGGKSLLLHSIEPSIHLTVSDNRPAIIYNLSERFSKNKIENYQSVIADLADGLPAELAGKEFDGLIADVPCSGSGTWSRTPENIFFFKPEIMEEYILRQKKILKTIATTLKKGSPLIYITCSVFKAENEEISEWICNNLGFKRDQQKIIKGYQNRADTMFAARLIKI